MIGTKKAEILAVLLTVAATAILVAVMYMAKDNVKNDNVITYSDKHSITVAYEDSYVPAISQGTMVKLADNGIETDGNSVFYQDGNVMILSEGIYTLSGKLKGSIIVDIPNKGTVNIILDNVDVTSSKSAALYVLEAGKTVISLPEGTENTFSDTENSSDVSAAIYSKDHIVINGSGKLTVNGNNADGIKSNDSFMLIGANIDVTGKDDGINVNDSILFDGGSVSITSQGDGIKCENESSAKGFIAADNTSFNINSKGDGIYASSAFYGSGGNFDIVTGEGSENAETGNRGFFFTEEDTDNNEKSTKAVKAGTFVDIKGGNYIIDSQDDGIHSDGNLSISDGSFEISCGDDAIHGGTNVAVCPESINITKCREGIEGEYIHINGGNINIVSGDDGVNATGPNSQQNFMPGGKSDYTEEEIYLFISQCDMTVVTDGDGLDSNGAARITGGKIRVYGPENGGNASLDYEYGLEINGGDVAAAGNSGMAEMPADTSEQSSISFYLDNEYKSNTEVVLKDNKGNEIVSFTPLKNFNWICVSNDKLTLGDTYILYVNGENVAQQEMTDNVTRYGEATGFGGMRGGMHGNRNGEMSGDTANGNMPQDMPNGEIPDNTGNMREHRMPRNMQNGEMPQDMQDGMPPMPQDMQNGENPQDMQRRMHDRPDISQNNNQNVDMSKYYTAGILAGVIISGFLFVLIYKRKSF